ncbi:unnamed protein product [Gongylonema pulchrum]|uniref:MFS domain-containing protein n=1 Tax=Gongylonema pulchrum TaxID=637853 RepID=A0A183DFW4_9BILA|nr:unnamed protein product [Gongylonema pulchrum]
MPVVFASYLQLPFPYIYTNKYQLLFVAVMNIAAAYLLGFQCSLLSEFPAMNIERAVRRYLEEKLQVNGDNHSDNIKMSELLTNAQVSEPVRGIGER